MKPFMVHLPEAYVKRLDALVEERYYSSRAEAIRHAVRNLLKEHEAFKPVNG